jgi:hypothetical protein
VRAVFVIIGQILKTKTAEMALVERDDMVENLAASAADPSFCNPVLPGTTHT